MYRSCPVAHGVRFKSALLDEVDHNSVATLWDSLLHHLGGGAEDWRDEEKLTERKHM